jgi:hypothetical protein
LTLQLRNHLLQPLLFIGRDGPIAPHLLDPVLAKDTGRGEVGQLRHHRRRDKGALLHPRLPLQGPHHLFREAVAGIGHGEGGRAGAGLGLHDLVAAELRAVGQGRAVGVRQHQTGDLGEEGQNGNAGVAADDGDLYRRGIDVTVRGDKGIGAQDVEGGDAAEFAGVVDTGAFQDFGGDGDGAVDGVADDGEDGFGAVDGTLLDEALDNTGVGVEEVVAGHTGFAGDTGGNDDDGGARQGGGEARVARGRPRSSGGQVACHGGFGGDL